MSWNNVLPWSFYARDYHYRTGKYLCGFEAEVLAGYMRDDF